MPPRVPPGSPRPWRDGKTAIYHITHVDNLAQIGQSGAILADASCASQGLKPASIAYDDLKARRARWPVSVAQGGTLAEYVPFYYAPRSPMLLAINGGAVAGCDEGQTPVVHLVLAAEDIAIPGRFAITDGHAAVPRTNQYENLADLDRVPWPMMFERYWRDTVEDPDRRRRRQAEFLAWDSVPFEAVQMIGVSTRAVADRVRGELAGASHVPDVVVRKDWYYG